MKFSKSLLIPDTKEDAEIIINVRITELKYDSLSGLYRIHPKSWAEMVLANLYLKNN